MELDSSETDEDVETYKKMREDSFLALENVIVLFEEGGIVVE